MLLRKKINLKMIMGFSGLFLIIMLALLFPLIFPYNSLDINLSRLLEAPSWEHPFGLDENGVDLLSQVLYGTRVSLIVALLVVSINLIVGLVVGSISGWCGLFVDQILMRLVDLVSAFPRFLLALAILSILGSSVFNLILAMCISGWAGFARLVRAEILHLKQEEHILNALAYGASVPRIFIFHIWPYLMGILFVQVAFSLVAVVIAEAGLSFLGLGIPSNIPSWGRLISSGREVLQEAPHLSIFPGLALFFLVLSFQLCGDGLRDFLDPKSS